MNTAKQAQEVLSAAEIKLRDLVSVAATGGEYETAGQIMAWAKILSELGAELNMAGASSDKPVPSQTDVVVQRNSRTPKKEEYPQFFRRNGQLIKIGWSKKHRKKYEHKAPRRVVDALATAIVGHTGNGKLFTVEELLPLNDPQDGNEMPGYQVYVALAWFKAAGLVEQHGRQGYAIRTPAKLEARVQQQWVLLSAT